MGTPSQASQYARIAATTWTAASKTAAIYLRCNKANSRWVRLFFVEDFSPYSWALLPADASLQWPFRRDLSGGHFGGTSSRPARTGVFPAASRASSRRRTPSVFSPSGALPSGHSRGVLVRCRGKGGRPAMAVTTGCTFDVPRTGVPCIDLPSRAPCAANGRGRHVRAAPGSRVCPALRQHQARRAGGFEDPHPGASGRLSVGARGDERACGHGRSAGVRSARAAVAGTRACWTHSAGRWSNTR